MMEENVVRSAGASFRMAKEEMIRLIRDIGETPAIRDTAYNTLEIFK
jgi:cyclic dehypoxanthinyl futalosine synthase